MDVSVEQLIDTGLNVAGFLAAGGLMLVLISLFRPRQSAEAEQKMPAAAKATAQSEAAPVSEAVARPEAPSAKLTFVSFDQSAAATPATTPKRREAGPREDRRAEVIKLARTLIAERQSEQVTARQLPLAEAELAMLSSDNK